MKTNVFKCKKNRKSYLIRLNFSKKKKNRKTARIFIKILKCKVTVGNILHVRQGNLDIYLYITCQFHFACIHLYDEINLHPQVVNKIIDGK
jgi:hypothetical protein